MRIRYGRIILAVFIVICILTGYMAYAEDKDLLPGGSPQITAINVTKISSNPLELQVSVKASVEDGLLYQIWGQDVDGWALIKAYDENKTCNWIPSAAADSRYKVQVRIKDAGGNLYDQKVEEITCHDLGILRVDKLTTNAAVDGQGEKGKPIVVTAYASGSDEIFYRFTVSKGNKWVVWSKFGKSNTFTWVPQSAGNFEIRVEVKNKNNSQNDVLAKLFNITETGYIYPEFTGLTFKATKSGAINIKASDIFRPGFLQSYKITIGEQLRDPEIISGYKGSPSYSWIDQQSGVYEVSAYVKDADSAKWEDAIRKTYKITKPDVGTVKLDSVDLSQPNPVQPKGTTMNFTASASGGSKLLYAFYRLEARGYRLIQDYSAQNTFTWTPVNAGEYTILTRVKDVNSGSYEDQKGIKYTITDSSIPAISVNSVNVSGTLKKGSNHVISVDAADSENLMYKFAVSDNFFDWVTLQEFSPNSTCSWIPKHGRNYRLIIWVKDMKAGSYQKQIIKNVQIAN